MRNCSRRRGQSKYERGEGLGNHHCAVGETRCPFEPDPAHFLQRNLHLDSYSVLVCVETRKTYGRPTASAISSRASGFSTEERSPGSLPSTRARTARRTTFALRVFGSADDEDDPLRPEGLPELVGHGGRDLERAVRGRVVARLEHAEDPRHLALHLVRDADGRGLRDCAMCDRRRLELRRADPLAGDVERVVGTAVQEPVAVLVDRRPVAVRPDAGEAAPVRVEIAIVVAPDRRASSPATDVCRRARRPRRGRDCRSRRRRPCPVRAQGSRAPPALPARSRRSRGSTRRPPCRRTSSRSERVPPPTARTATVRIAVPRLARRADRLQR